MHLLIIHSDINAINDIKSGVGEAIQVSSVATYADGQKLCSETSPDMIIAQSQIDDQNAFDFTTMIRLTAQTPTMPIVIISEDANPKERVRTFQVGADDYIAPFDLPHLLAVVQHEVRLNDKLKALEAEKNVASSLVMEAMKNSSELGNAITFIERCHRFQSVDEIATEICAFCRTLELKVVIGVQQAEQWFFMSSNDEVKDLERDLMRSIHQQDRFVDFGIRTQMNWPNIALLVKNMPIREPEKYGRVKDLLPTLLSSANVRVQSLYEEHCINEQTSLMTRSIETLQPAIESAVLAMAEDAKTQRHALSEFLQKIIVALPGLGLEDDQEDFFISQVESLIQNADDMAAKNQKHQATLRNTSEAMLTLLQKQNELQELISKPVEIADKPADGSDDLFELF